MSGTQKKILYIDMDNVLVDFRSHTLNIFSTLGTN